MQFNPEIRTDLSDPAGLQAQQAAHQAALDRWRASPPAAAVLDAFAAFAAGRPLSALPALAALFDGSDRARRFAEGLAASFLPAMAAARFGQVPLRHSHSRAAATVMLAREGEASLSLVALDGVGLALQPCAASAAFAQAEEWDVVIAGTGQGRLAERHGAPGIAVHPLRLEPGVALGRDAAREALLVDAAHGTLLLLRLRRRRPGPEPVREFALADGAPLHQSVSCARESRHEIAVALLGRMGRVDAAPLLAEIAADPALGDMLRWQALRKCLALDTRAGFLAVVRLAWASGDPLAHAAGALRAQLIEAHPILAEIEPCPV
ncbi:hypothetical protein H7F51_09635 [Novosphingobium flavum]|uniref:Uncharacterized protein n=1 Tax=Novosphingobium flavum TaxID=1778672 RepID=A0A7X1FS11_9SPHN|nr:hypothetical protein [Novosphingobium flavum]MBC2665784.1 hypothetical protein [Novosphingobium flavum]